MNDYMTALHQRFYREPDFSELEEEIEEARQEVRDYLDKMQWRRLMDSSWPGGLPGNWREMACTPSKRRKSSEPARLWNRR